MALLALTVAQLFTPLEIIEDSIVIVEDRTIRAVGARGEIAIPSGARRVDLGDQILAPGFVDLHIHGAAGHDLMEATPEALEAVAAFVLEHGTTSFVPTTLSAPASDLLRALEGIGMTIRSWKANASGTPRAEPLGIHLEGPFLSAERRGAHPREHLEKPLLGRFREMLAAADGSLLIVTLAPELEGAGELQACAIQNGARVGLGHSNATYEQARDAIDAGASHAVHIFNAMRPFSHRDPGILGAVLTDDRVRAEVIADSVHVSEPALRLLVRAKGVCRIALITDAVSATGMGPGRYTLGGMEIRVDDDPQTGLPACRNSEGKLAGSVLTQDRAVRNILRATGVSLCEAVRMASANPAELLGLGDRKGVLRSGADADLVVLDPAGNVTGTMALGVGNFL